MNGNGRIIGTQKQMSQIDDKDEDEEIQKWRCAKCQFDNLYLRECEMCHTPRISYPVSSEENLRRSTLSLSSQQGAVGGNHSGQSFRGHRRRLSLAERDLLPLIDYSLLHTLDPRTDEDNNNPQVPVMVMMPLSAFMNLRVNEIRNQNERNISNFPFQSSTNTSSSDTNANTLRSNQFLTRTNSCSVPCRNCCHCCCHDNNANNTNANYGRNAEHNNHNS